MSAFLGGASGGTAGVGTFAGDDTLLAERFGSAEWNPWVHPLDCYVYQHSLASPWWPGNVGFDASGGEWHEAVWFEQPDFNTGTISRFAIVGVTRDANKSILGSATVKLFKTADGSYVGTKDSKVDEGVSDPNTGAFYLTTPYYPDTHYVVMQKSGTPDVQGVTVNTLIGV